MSKKAKQTIKFLALCLNFVNVVLMVVVLFTPVPAWVSWVALFVDAVIDCIIGYQDWYEE